MFCVCLIYHFESPRIAYQQASNPVASLEARIPFQKTRFIYICPMVFTSIVLLTTTKWDTCRRENRQLPQTGKGDWVTRSLHVPDLGETYLLWCQAPSFFKLWIFQNRCKVFPHRVESRINIAVDILDRHFCGERKRSKELKPAWKHVSTSAAVLCYTSICWSGWLYRFLDQIMICIEKKGGPISGVTLCLDWSK